MTDLALKVDGSVYGGWKTITVQRGVRRFADTFDLSLTERWAGQDTVRPIKPDSACVIEIEGETVITGYVDDVPVTYGAKNHDVNVNGRSRLGDLVDCSGDISGFKNYKLDAIAKKICAHFDIDVIVETDIGGKFKNPIKEVGETYHEFLSRLASYRAVYLTSNNQGNLVIARASKDRISTALVLGENVLSASGNNSKRERFYQYTVTGQQAGDDNTFGSSAAHVSGKAFDTQIRKARTITIVPDDLTLSDAKRIAEYERNVRYGESQAVTYTVNGWHHKDGLWRPNKRVPVVDPWLQIDEDRLITHVSYIMDDDGKRCELEVMPPEALDLVPLPEGDDDDGF